MNRQRTYLLLPANKIPLRFIIVSFYFIFNFVPPKRKNKLGVFCQSKDFDK